MKRLAIIGAGDLGVQLAHLAAAVPEIMAVGFFDDRHDAGSEVDGIAVLGGIEAVSERYRQGAFDQILIGIGYKHMAFRRQLYKRLQPEIPFARLLHPTAWIDPEAIIEPGVVIYPGCLVDRQARIGANTLLNIGCVIAHHTAIGQSCFLAPAVKLAGFVTVGTGVTLGIGTTVVDNVSIASGIRTGAGSVVVGDLELAGLYFGVPARWQKSEPQ